MPPEIVAMALSRLRRHRERAAARAVCWQWRELLPDTDIGKCAGHVGISSYSAATAASFKAYLTILEYVDHRIVDAVHDSAATAASFKAYLTILEYVDHRIVDAVRELAAVDAEWRVDIRVSVDKANLYLWLKTYAPLSRQPSSVSFEPTYFAGPSVRIFIVGDTYAADTQIRMVPINIPLDLFTTRIACHNAPIRALALHMRSVVLKYYSVLGDPQLRAKIRRVAELIRTAELPPLISRTVEGFRSYSYRGGLTINAKWVAGCV
jgi:hypothetical protein